MTHSTKRTAITVLRVFNALGLTFLVVLGLVTLSKIAEQTTKNHDDSVASTTRVEADLNCLGRFFSQTNRLNLKISDLTTCTIRDTSTGKTTTLQGDPKPKVITNTAPQPTASPNQPDTSTPMQQPTTSAPPDPQPGTIQQVINKVKDIL
jgi:hypothetical protein